MPVLRCCLLTASTCVLVATAYGQGGPPLLLREPALSASEICFSFAGDLWTVPRTGGTGAPADGVARDRVRLPLFPRGRWIAYTNVSNNNADVYVIAAGGGTPRRLTYRPSADRVRGWTADGKVLFMSDRDGIALAQARRCPAAVRRRRPTGCARPRSTCRACGTAPSAATASGWPTCRFRPRTGRGSAIAAGSTTPIWIATLADASIEKVPARELDRHVADVDRRHGVLRVRPGRAHDPLRLRHAHQARGTADREPRARHQVRLRRTGRRSYTSSSARSACTTWPPAARRRCQSRSPASSRPRCRIGCPWGTSCSIRRSRPPACARRSRRAARS